MDDGITRFVEKAKKSLREAYRLTIHHNFTIGTDIQNGSTIPVTAPTESCPSFAQFYYRIRLRRRNGDHLLKVKGEREFQRNFRPLTGKFETSGPGAVYQIDPTPLEIYLVSSLRASEVIGNPYLYLVVDTFSHLIVGYNLTLEHPSYRQAALAIECAASSKKEWCAARGVEIQTSDWPAHHVPHSILSDRGELKGSMASSIVNNLGVQVSTTAAYQPSMKGLVERYIGLFTQEVIYDFSLPGSFKRFETRGVKNPRQDASLTIQELETFVIRWILKRNSQTLAQFHPTQNQIADKVPNVPLALWNWGLELYGAPRIVSTENLRKALLPPNTATICREGIRFQKLFFSCQSAEEGKWFSRARAEKPWKVPIVFDPRDASHIYLRAERNGPLETCDLLPRSEPFRGKSWEEVKLCHAAASISDPDIQRKASQHDAVLRSVVQASIAKSKKELIGIRRPSRQNIQLNRKLEIAVAQRIPPQSPLIVHQKLDAVESRQLALLKNRRRNDDC